MELSIIKRFKRRDCMSKVILKEGHVIFRKAFRKFLEQHAAPNFE